MSAYDVAIVGAGPAGLAAAAQLARRARVVVLDREDAPGGVPRHSAHTGYGIRDLHRVMSGPRYARTLSERASAAGAELRANATVTGVGDGFVEVTSPSGRERIEAQAVILATGCRERPRTARLVPGSRPAGVYTTGWLQRLVHLEHGSPGRTAVIVGAEHVSYSAVLTLAHAGCRTAAIITDDSRPNTVRGFDLAVRARSHAPLITGARIERIEGRDRVAAVVLADGRRIECDCIVFTGDWIPEHELARRAGLEMSGASPSVDSGLRTSQPGVFAAGNLLHAAATADICALDGSHLLAPVTDWLEHHTWPASIEIRVQSPLLWAAPSRLDPHQPPPRGRILMASGRRLRLPEIAATQGGRVLGTHRLPWLEPTRPMSIRATWLDAVDPAGPPIEIGIPTLPA